VIMATLSGKRMAVLPTNESSLQSAGSKPGRKRVLYP
jgi:hypothetical protein